MHYVLTYLYVDDYLQRREPLRADHLKLAWQFHESGSLVLGGVLDDPLDEALLVFNSDSPQVVHDFVSNDPYVQQGLVKQWRVRPWRTVVGATASSPLRP